MNGSAKDLKPLLDLLLDQQCDDEQGERIEELLAEDPQLLDQYIENLRLHSMLQWHCDTPAALLPEAEVAVSPAPKPAPARRRLSRSRVIGALFATTAVVLLVVVGLNNFWLVDDSAPVVGWFSDVEGVVWSDDQTPTDEGASFAAGEIRTNGGRLELQFKSGATVRCDGPSAIDVLSGMRVRIAQGKISVRIAESAKGFVIETPDAEVIDLGTEFGVDVRDGEHTDVVVFDGEVDVQRKKVEDPQRLTKGEAVRVDTHGDPQRIVQVNRETQSDSWSVGESGSNDSVIRSIRDNIRDSDEKKYYEIMPSGFDEDALSYVDRLHEWNGLTEDGLPAFLRGGDYVKTFNSDKTQSDLKIQLRVTGPAVLYVLYDNRCPVPSWLSESFTDTDVDIGRDIVGRRSSQESDGGPDKGIDKFASVWRLQVDGSEEIVLGHVERGPRGARAMYGIVAVPANRDIVAPKSN